MNFVLRIALGDDNYHILINQSLTSLSRPTPVSKIHLYCEKKQRGREKEK